MKVTASQDIGCERHLARADLHKEINDPLISEDDWRLVVILIHNQFISGPLGNKLRIKIKKTLTACLHFSKFIFISKRKRNEKRELGEGKETER